MVLESWGHVTDSEQTELLREILTEIRELKNMISQNFQRKQELEIAEQAERDGLHSRCEAENMVLESWGL
jgi:hypothetical protein